MSHPWENKALSSKDVVTGSFWDSTVFRPFSSELTRQQLFSIPLCQQRTMFETNMHQAQRLPAPQEMQVQQIKFSFPGNSQIEDVCSIADSSFFTLWLGMKSYARAIIGSLEVRQGSAAPIHVCEFCHSVYASATNCPNCGAAKFRLSSSGESLASGKCFILPLLIPLMIPWGMCFYVELETQPYGPLSHETRMWCHLEGLVAREVQ